TKNDKGEMVYEPRAKEEIDRIAALVRTAIGFDQKRGDQVEVANLRLAETPSIPIAEPTGWMSYFQFTKDDAMRGIELLVMALLGLVVLLFGIRPLVRRVIGSDPAQIAGGTTLIPLAGGGFATVGGATAAAIAAGGGAAGGAGSGAVPGGAGVNVKGG